MFFPLQSSNNLSYPQMETAWRSVSNSGGAGDGAGEIGDASGGQNGHFTNHAWDNWDIGTATTNPPADATRYDWSNHDVCEVTAADTATRGPAASVVHALLLGVTNDNMNMNIHRNNSGHRIPDPHMMCLKLGKRHYFENGVVPDRRVAAELSGTKRGKPPYSYYVSDNTTLTTTGAWPASSAVTVVSSPPTVPRCQVEGCHVALTNAKEYYRRHKVCEVHSKCPKVVVLGLQQRFCQQCSRFHGVTEFDEAKRSCRRRLEGHNQRRRKGTLSHSNENNLLMKGRFRTLSTLSPSPPPSSKPGCALSLLSSPKTETWISSNDLSSRCSAALCELIAENRATTVFGHFWDQNTSHQPMLENTIDTIPNTQIWDRLNDVSNTTMTLDLMQDPTSDFRFLSMKGKSKDPEECNDYCWSAYGGTNVV